MKKILSTVIMSVLCVIASLCLVACGGGSDNGGEPSGKPTFQGVSMADATFAYDGNEHSLAVTGTLPDGTEVSYQNNGKTDAGVYTVTATLRNEEYADKTLTATLIITPLQFQGVSMADLTVAYDGQPHSLAVSGDLPEGTDVAYQNNDKTNAGTYTVTATLTKKNYETKALTATLEITKLDFAGITFSDKTEAYDGTAHTIEIMGQLPAGTTVTYSCAENADVTNSATASGTYTITATLRNPNFNDVQLTAKLTITAADKERHIGYAGGTLYFANALDGDKLYSYSGGAVQKVSGDVPYDFTDTSGGMFFRSGALASSIKKIGSGKTEAQSSMRGNSLCANDGGTTFYYAYNALSAEKRGIYAVTLTGGDPVETKISAGRAYNLRYYNGQLYFADGENGKKLSKIPASGGARTVVVDEAIKTLTVSNGTLFYTVNNLIGDYIESYNISSGTRCKLTSDAGNNLTVVGNKLYYLNTDWLTSTVNGKGIYRVDAYPVVANNAAGEKVIGEQDEKYSSLAAAGSGSIAYYRASDQMLCVYDVAAQTTTEVLDGFVAPEVTPLSTGSKTGVYGKTLYFLDLYNDKALYAYDTVGGGLSRVTSNKVSDFAIIGDVLYFNQVSWGVNNDLYKVDLKLGGEPELVSTNDCVDIVSDGENVYYVEQNAAGARTAIHKIAADGTDTTMYSKGVDNLTYYKGNLYFVDGKDLLKMPTTGWTYNEPETVRKGNSDAFIIVDDVIYMRRMTGLAWVNKQLVRMDLDGSNEQVILSNDTDPLEMLVYDGYVYYFNDLTNNPSLRRVATSVRDNGTAEELVKGKNASALTMLDGKIYFVDYRNNLGDSHLYCYDLTTKSVTKIA